MNRNRKHRRILCLAALLVILLGSCSPAPLPSTPSAIAPQPTTNAQPTIVAQPTPTSAPSVFKADVRYGDASGDMGISFLDVVAFRASVDEETETVKVVLEMRDVPDSAPRGQVTNFPEYLWMVSVYLDPTKAVSPDSPGDYYFALNTEAENVAAAGSLTPVPGTPVVVPFHQLFEINYIYNSSAPTVSTPEIEVNPDRDTITLMGHIPGITSAAGFRFSMNYYDGTKDEPDGTVHPEPASAVTPLENPTSQPASAEQDLQLQPAGAVRAFPGPEHYAGDILTFGIKPSSGFSESTPLSMALDGRDPIQAPAPYYWFGEVIVPSALDTTDMTGHHTLTFRSTDGSINETYSFEVLPAGQRPVDETRATWQTMETECCVFHYLSGTAAARDIDFIAEHFQKGAGELETTLKAEIESRMNIYILDRMLMNGGLGGNGQIAICYTDRYYGPTIDGEGLETLARHEFSHAADIGLTEAGDGLDFNYEGLAVYLAGGHYKPEPLAQRAAALYDLGHSAPVNEFIPQHELSYLHAAAILTYIAETYGEEKLWEFFRADTNTPDGQPLPMQDAIALTFGIPLEEFDQGFQAWMEGNDPGEQLEDLRLTLDLQDARREYQDLYAPDPLFLLSEIDVSAFTRPEYLSIVMREVHAPANIAVELLIANAQRAIIAGAYPEAEQLIASIQAVVSTGDFADPLARQYLDVVLAATEAGYEVVSLSLQNGHATAQVVTDPPVTTILELRNTNGVWQVQP